MDGAAGRAMQVRDAAAAGDSPAGEAPIPASARKCERKMLEPKRRLCV